MDSQVPVGIATLVGPSPVAGQPPSWLPDEASLLDLVGSDPSVPADSIGTAYVELATAPAGGVATSTAVLSAWLMVQSRLLGSSATSVVMGLAHGGLAGLTVQVSAGIRWTEWCGQVEQAIARMVPFSADAGSVEMARPVLWLAEGAAAPTGSQRPPICLSLAGASGQTMKLVATHSLRSIDQRTMSALLECVAAIIETVSTDTYVHPALEQLPMLRESDRADLLALGRGPRVSIAIDEDVVSVFDNLVAVQPDALAVLSDGASLTYAELRDRSRRFAATLAAAGALPGETVALAIAGRPEAIVAMLGILRAGAAYLPVDPRSPPRVVNELLQAAHVHLVVVDRSEDVPNNAPGADELFAGCRRIDSGLAASAAPTSASSPRCARDGRRLAAAPAYLMFSSGSTGTPKGIVIPHRAILRLVKSAGFMRLGPGERILQAAPLGFDASTLEIWGPLLNGGCCVIHAEPVVSARGLQRTIEDHRVSGAWLTAALFNLIVDDHPLALRSLRQLVTGGEALSPAHVDRALAALPDLELINGYGPTENTTFTTTSLIARRAPDRPDRRSVPIGRPVNNTDCVVLGADRRMLPRGLIGELYVAGDGLALGYHGDPALTAASFPRDAAVPRARWYRTGDLVRWLDDGQLDYVGRADSQVKIRGFRIELAGIEAELLRLPGVDACAVNSWRHPIRGTSLCAYVVGPAAADRAGLRAVLAGRLPDYMVPADFLALPSLPLTANGKLDRRALPMPSEQRPEQSEPYVAPRGAQESLVADVFAQVLGIDRAGRLDNFFDLGGNSLLVMRALDLINQRATAAVRSVDFFSDPSVRGLASALSDAMGAVGVTGAAGTVGTATPRRPEPFSAFVPAAAVAVGSLGAAGVEAPVDATPSSTASTASNGSNGPNSSTAPEPIAIIGMAGRFPGASSVDVFWRNLCEGRDSIRRFSPDELDASIPAELRADSAYVAARGVLDDVDLFDAAFFGVNPREAELMDPQQRVFLEICWEALERAGELPRGQIGVFGGMNNATYFQHHVSAHPDSVERVGAFPVMLANEKDYVALRTANRLNLKGPAISLNTACSTALVAIGQAFDSLRAGHCDMALAGGVSITCPPNSGYLYQEGSMLSPDGRTRSFDAASQGTVFSDGAAVVLLKPLSRALADGNPVFAVIKSVAVNNDGGDKASFTAPSVDGQQQVVTAALRRAGVSADSISYLEAHGTATPLGDPVEVEALRRAFVADRVTSASTPNAAGHVCGIGSVKSNVGHTVMAAGAAGLIKTALALTHESIPATLHFESPNPKIDFSATPFHVIDRPTPWPRGAAPRRAGVSSFGVGGTNAHAILEEAPLRAPSPAASGAQLLRLSARSAAALQSSALRLADHLAAHPDENLADVAYTLEQGRTAFAWRLAVSTDSTADAVTSLRDLPAATRRGHAASRSLGEQVPAVIWMFPGQGAQFLGMGRTRWASDPAFAAAFDQCLQALADADVDNAADARTNAKVDAKTEARADRRDAQAWRALIWGTDGDALDATEVTQPAMFCIEYALARAWQAAGHEAAALIGHSIGEFAAAALAGVMSLGDAARLVVARGRLMQALPRGSMLSVRLTPTALEALLPRDLALAAINAPQACVVAGETSRVQAFAHELDAGGIANRLLRTSHAFHSPMMDAAVAPFEALVRQIVLRAPDRPIYSTLHGRLMTATEAVDPRYWSQHMREPVRFSQALSAALQAFPAAVLLELGPRATLCAMARQHAVQGTPMPPAVPCLGEAADEEDHAHQMALGQLWTLGVEPNAVTASTSAALMSGAANRRRVVLPTYPFERKRFWVDTGAPRSIPAAAASTFASPDSMLAAIAVSPVASPIAPSIAPPFAPPFAPATASPTASPIAPPIFVQPFSPVIDGVMTPQPDYAGPLQMNAMTLDSRYERLITGLREVFEDISGLALADADASASFVELGLDSLMLTQVALQLKKRYTVPISFRQLMESLRTFDELAKHLDGVLPADSPAAPGVVAPAAATPGAAGPAPVAQGQMPVTMQTPASALMPAPMSASAPAALSAALQTAAGLLQAGGATAHSMAAPINGSLVHQVITQQMQLLSQQLALLSGMGSRLMAMPMTETAVAPSTTALTSPAMAPTPTAAALTPSTPPAEATAAEQAAQAIQGAQAASAAAVSPTVTATDDGPQKATYDVKKAFGAIARIRKQDAELTDLQRVRLEALIRRYVERTQKSKAYTERHRPHLADPRVVNGFSPKLKEMIYQIVIERSKGAHLWDLDGNRYVDVLNGFGMSLFGWQPDFVLKAVREQLDAGYEIGPQHPLAGEVAELICELTGFDRAALCNTGSEAVMAAVRMARTVTGRDTVVLFSGSYHGTFDEVVVRQGRGSKGLPAAPGIMPGMFGDVRVLEYGTPESLAYIREHADDIAAVLVEAVQSRRPDFQPREFLKEVRAITAEKGACLIFDEVITGFRAHLGGVQHLFGIKADLATYGKVIGGGYPVGVVAGRRDYMDALDGGAWQYGDDSVPTVGVTYFAGTFVRHPLALSACKAALLHLKNQGVALQTQLNLHTACLADELNAYCREVGAPVQIRHFASLWRVAMLEDHPMQDLLFAMMRTRGVHILDNFPCFLTTAHMPEDIALIKTAFKESIAELQASDFLPRRVKAPAVLDASRPPVPDARLGRGKDGRPAWFVPDPDAVGKYKKLNV